MAAVVRHPLRHGQDAAFLSPPPPHPCSLPQHPVSLTGGHRDPCVPFPGRPLVLWSALWPHACCHTLLSVTLCCQTAEPVPGPCRPQSMHGNDNQSAAVVVVFLNWGERCSYMQHMDSSITGQMTEDAATGYKPRGWS